MVVEWVRTCFSSEWRLFRNNDALVPGRYVRAPAGTPHYDGWHNLGSRDWTSDERDPWPELGEWDGKREYYNGVSPEPFPRPILIGSADQVANGAFFPPSIDREFLDGFDCRCYTTPRLIPPEALAPIDITDRNTAIFYALILDLLYDNPGAAQALVESNLGPTATVTVVPNGDPLVPGSLVAVTPTQTIIVVSGTTTAQQLALQFLYGTAGVADYVAFSTLIFWFEATSAILIRASAAGADASRPVIFIGHSYGGAIATIAATRVQYGVPNANVQLLTYGAPRPGDSRMREILAPVRQVHYANVGDPVPALAPTGQELFPFASFAPPDFLERWNMVRQSGGVIGLASNGDTRAYGPTLYDFQQVYDAVLSAIAAITIGPYFAHSIKEYYRRLARLP